MKYIKDNPNSTCTCSNWRHHAQWDLEPQKILRSLEAVFKYQDINKLTKDTYTFLHNLSGFIAHYDINGFKSNYEDLRSLIAQLNASSDIEDPTRYIRDKYFSEGEQKLYYAQKAEVLSKIPGIIEKYYGGIHVNFYEKQRTEEIDQAEAILSKYGLKIKKE